MQPVLGARCLAYTERAQKDDRPQRSYHTRTPCRFSVERNETNFSLLCGNVCLIRKQDAGAGEPSQTHSKSVLTSQRGFLIGSEGLQRTLKPVFPHIEPVRANSKSALKSLPRPPPFFSTQSVRRQRLGPFFKTFPILQKKKYKR